jgi:thiosulfate/3-mercaptopyruvate sulfurtransferase
VKGPQNKSTGRRIILVFTLLLVVLWLTGCDSEEPTPDTEEDFVEVEIVSPDARETEEAAGVGEGDVTEVLVETAVAPEPTNECLACHIDQERLMATATPIEAISNENEGEGRGGQVIPLTAWEKVLVDNETYPETVHGQIPCQDCHGGVQSPDKAAAHDGLVINPSSEPETTCGECHPNVVAANEFSLHANLTGMRTVLSERATSANYDIIAQAFDNNYYGNAACGDCHVSRPEVVGSGLIDGHNFNAQPSMTANCTACHDNTVGREYLGQHEGLAGDVHFRQGDMTCLDCHTGPELHGQPANCQDCHEGPEAASVAPADHRYAGVQSPRCETCHVSVAIGQDDIFMHQQHGGDLSCQVCHSVEYTSCDGCHVATSETTGNPVYTLDSSYLSFKIGRNPLKSYDRPYEYVTLRHVPVSPDSFTFYGDNLLSNFSALPTWTYATPHNIQRQTPQAESCTSCHGQSELFLTIDDLAPEEVEANLSIIVESVPRPITEILASPRITVTQPVTTTEE